MNSGVKNGAKYKISSFIKFVFLLIMALFAAVPLFQVLLNAFRSDRECKTMP